MAHCRAAPGIEPVGHARSGARACPRAAPRYDGPMPFVRAAALACLLASAPAFAMDPASHPIDDRSGPAPAAWRFFTDGVMGGVSSGAITNEVVRGRPALCLRGRVRLENNGGFIQMALDVVPPPGTWTGLELDLTGNDHAYGVHLRTTRLTAPWQAWRARVTVTPQWQTVRLPFAKFEPYRFGGTLEPGEIRRIGLVALGEAFDAELCVARAAWIR
jgi:hypothetical protein